jgi:nucleotide-binding universal stress UspA family protein
MNGTIICTIDDSEGAEAAIQIARRLAERFDARMLLVSIADGFRAGPVGGEGVTATQGRAGAKRRLERLVAAHDLAGAEHRLAAGDPAEAVAVIAAEEAADLIVVGARRGLLGRTLRSPLARQLAATAACPVVVAPPESRDPTGEPVQHSSLARHR